MKRTRINELFDIEFPIIQGGMIWVSGSELAAAVSGAGGLGLLGAGSMTEEELSCEIRRCAELTDRPFGVNLPVFNPRADQLVDIIIDEGVRIVFSSGGSPKRFTDRFKQEGIKVAHVCSTPSLAAKCEAAGVDAVVCEGFEAGGHNGRDELTSMVLVPQTVDAVSIPVIAAGGIADGRGVAAALMLGAEGVQIGSRFAATQEASGHQAFKDAIIEADATDTQLVLKSLIPVRLIKNAFCMRVFKAEQEGVERERLSEMLGRGRSQLGMQNGDISEGELEIGQVAGLLHDIPSAAQVVRDLVEGYKRTIRQVPKET